MAVLLERTDAGVAQSEILMFAVVEGYLDDLFGARVTVGTEMAVAALAGGLDCHDGRTGQLVGALGQLIRRNTAFFVL